MEQSSHFISTQLHSESVDASSPTPGWHGHNAFRGNHLICIPNWNSPVNRFWLSQEELNGIEFSCDQITDLGRFDEIINEDRGVPTVVNPEVLQALQGIDVERDSDTFRYNIFVQALQAAYGAIQSIPVLF